MCMKWPGTRGSDTKSGDAECSLSRYSTASLSGATVSGPPCPTPSPPSRARARLPEPEPAPDFLRPNPTIGVSSWHGATLSSKVAPRLGDYPRFLALTKRLNVRSIFSMRSSSSGDKGWM